MKLNRRLPALGLIVAAALFVGDANLMFVPDKSLMWVIENALAGAYITLAVVLWGNDGAEQTTK